MAFWGKKMGAVESKSAAEGKAAAIKMTLHTRDVLD